jgi:hypothetical protein
MIVNYKTQLLKEHSRWNTDLISKAVGNSSTELKKIIDIVYNEKAPLPQRASWVLVAVNAKHSELLRPYIPLFINTISEFKIDGIKRNILSVISSHSIPKRYQVKLIDLCFNFLLSSDEKVAVKVHAMQTVANIALYHPELKQELKAVITDQWSKNSAAFQARARKVLKIMEKSL